MVTSNHPKQITGLLVERFGDWRNTKLGTLPLRQLRPTEVLIKCEAAALNFQDLLMIEGKYQFKPAAFPFIPGSDLAGTIVALGADIDQFALGQKIAALVQTGAFAGYAIAASSECFAIPDDIDFAKAAASTCVFATAVFALTMRGQVRAGELVMITGAAGGVGIAAIQYARQIGAEVVALVSSEAKEQIVRQAGADHVVRLDHLADPKEDLRKALAKSALRELDVVVDTVSGDIFDGAIRCLRPGGRIVVVGFASGRIAQLTTSYVLLKGISVIGSALKYGLEDPTHTLMERMAQVYKDVALGNLDPMITKTYPLQEFHRAATQIAERRAAGKIVLVPGPGAPHASG